MIAIRITEHGRVWPAEEIAALGEVRTLADLERALAARGYRCHDLTHSGDVMRATVEHDVPAVTGESVAGPQMFGLFQSARDGDLVRAAAVALGLVASDPTTREQARARCAAAINARRGAR